MDKSVLNDVIGAEKEIQTLIEQEQARLQEMLERTRREAAELLAEEERSYGAARDREHERARSEAEARARRIIEDASVAAERLDKLDDGALTRIVLKQIPRILLE
jgi:vacuolar-type H+-ATPase subunit H